MIKKRVKYGLIHLGLSVIFTFPCLYLILGVWYPDVMPKLFGLFPLLGIFILVNLILWPSFSALIYKLDKQELKRDLTIMGTLQILISGFMLFYLYQFRPVWISLTIDFFEIVRLKDIVHDKYPNQIDVNTGFLDSYQILGTSFSDDFQQKAEQQNNDIFGKRISRFPSALVNLKDKREDLNKAMLPLMDLKKYNPEKEVNSVLAKYPQATGYFPLQGYVKDGAVLTNKDFTWFQPVNLCPWEDDSLLSPSSPP